LGFNFAVVEPDFYNVAPPDLCYVELEADPEYAVRTMMYDESGRYSYRITFLSSEDDPVSAEAIEAFRIHTIEGCEELAWKIVLMEYPRTAP
jgi:hypothetical protein